MLNLMPKLRKNSHILLLYIFCHILSLSGISIAGLYAALYYDIGWFVLVSVVVSLIWCLAHIPITNAVTKYYGFDD